jgi:hypothetical protein
MPAHRKKAYHAGIYRIIPASLVAIRLAGLPETGALVMVDVLDPAPFCHGLEEFIKPNDPTGSTNCPVAFFCPGLCKVVSHNFVFRSGRKTRLKI